MLVFMVNNLDLISTLNDIGYGLLRWENLPCYANTDYTYISTITNITYLDDDPKFVNSIKLSYSDTDIIVSFKYINNSTVNEYSIYSGDRGDVSSLDPYYFLSYVLFVWIYQQLGKTEQVPQYYLSTPQSVAEFYLKVKENSKAYSDGVYSAIKYTDSIGGIYKYTYTLDDNGYTPIDLAYAVSS